VVSKSLATTANPTQLKPTLFKAVAAICQLSNTQPLNIMQQVQLDSHW
jgi:hypothetical protein